MALILSIDTSLENAAIALSNDLQILATAGNSSQNDHAAWIHEAIRELVASDGKQVKEIEAVMVSSGPGSYTGLRVGMATAKGLCFASGIPLVMENTLKLTAFRAKNTLKPAVDAKSFFICPMIDARRMEVFTCLYDEELKEVISPMAMVLQEDSFRENLGERKVVFCGNGAAKWSNMCKNDNASFMHIQHHIEDLVELGYEKLKNGLLSDIAYSEPDYFKNAYMLK